MNYVAADNNRLTTFIFYDTPGLTTLYLNYNALPFSQLPAPGPSYATYKYSPRNKIFQERIIPTGASVDFSGEATINGVATVFSWYKENTLIAGTDQSGTYTVTEAGVYCCKMTNSNFTGLTLQTNNITVVDPVSLQINFTNGWKIFSTNVLPGIADIKEIFQPLISTWKLMKIIDETGNSLEDFGFFGGWTNKIGDIFLTEGYKVKVNGNCQLSIAGAPASFPFKIPLKAGWNNIGYPRQAEIEATAVIQQLIDCGTMFKVQDEKGNSLEDYGIFGGWINNIGNFSPGKGYKVKVTKDEVLTIYDSYPKTGNISLPETEKTVHFRPNNENGVDHMNINIVNLPSAFLQPGDEIAIFDNNICVGAVKLHLHHLTHLVVSIPATASDGTRETGFKEGNPFTVKLWKLKSGQEYPVEPQIIKGTSTFVKQESSLISLGNPTVTDLTEKPVSGAHAIHI